MDRGKRFDAPAAGAGARVVLVFVAALLALGGAEAARAQGNTPPPVGVATPVEREVVEWDEYTGRFEAAQRVAVQARVSGYLDSIHFEDGQLVEKGDLLFVIDPRPFEAAQARAEANLERARSQLALAELDRRRGERLLPRGAITQEEVDTRRANEKIAQAEVAAAEAELRAAELDIEFTRVTAPIGGRISATDVDVGNLIVGGAGAATPLTSIVAVEPIHFVFDVSESEYLRYVRRYGSGGEAVNGGRSETVFVRLLDETGWERRGRLDFMDNAFDVNTGTLRLRARFDNPERILLPGVFGRLRLAASPPYDALLIPEKAILSDQSAKIALVVGEDGTVEPRRLELGPLRGALRVVRTGIAPGERVIVEGLLRARPGAKVTAQEISIAGDGGAPPADARN